MKPPKNCISIDEARALQTRWVNTRAQAIKNAMGAEDAREVLFSIEELQEYIDYVKAESAAQGITDPGVRVYFGAYTAEKGNRATVFLAPTEGTQSTSKNNYKIKAYNQIFGGWPPFGY